MEIAIAEGALEKSTIDKRLVETLPSELQTRIIGFLANLKGIKKIQVRASRQEFILEFSSFNAAFDFFTSGSMAELCQMIKFLRSHPF